MINDQEGDRLWKMIDEKGRPFADFIQRQGSFAYSGFPKSTPIHFYQVATEKLYLSHSDKSTRYKSKNGVLVRSKSETLIANFLHDRGYRFEYERSTLLGKKIIRPDFYLPDYDVYIEHLGLYDTNPDYRQDWVWRDNLYKSNGCKVVTTLESDIPNLDAVLLKKLASVGCLHK
jgi:hypothetical protein